MERILSGEVAWYVTGRFYASRDGTLQDVGYFLHVQGIDAPLFNGAPGEATAHLTFVADPFTATDLRNGDLTLGLDAVGGFTVYYNASPGADFGDPASFGAGERIARFRRAAIVTGTDVGIGSADQPRFSLNVFSARLVFSRPFTHGGRRYDLGTLMPNGITQWGTASSTPVPGMPEYRSVIPFTGSAIAIGGGREGAHP